MGDSCHVPPTQLMARLGLEGVTVVVVVLVVVGLTYLYKE